MRLRVRVRVRVSSYCCWASGVKLKLPSSIGRSGSRSLPPERRRGDRRNARCILSYAIVVLCCVALCYELKWMPLFISKNGDHSFRFNLWLFLSLFLCYNTLASSS